MLTSTQAKKILKIKNYGTFVYHTMRHGIRPVKEEVVKGRFTKFYDEDDINLLKKKMKK